MRRPARLGLVALTLGLTLLSAGPARTEPELAVAAEVVGTTPSLQVRVEVRNRSPRAVPAVQIVGDLLGQRQEGRILSGVPAGDSRTVLLDFGAARALPGVYALVLLLEHAIEGAPDAAGNPPLASQRAALLVGLGSQAGPAVRLQPSPARLEVTGPLQVEVRSADGAPHRVRLRAFTPRGLRAEGDGVEVEVPAQGAVVASLPLVRAGAPRGTRHSVEIVAETRGEAPVRTSVAPASVAIAADRALLPRWRTSILVAAVLLLALAIGVEVWTRVRG